MQGTLQEIEQIKQLRNNGLTLNEIGKTINSNYETVRRKAHKYGIIKPRNINKRLSEEDVLHFKEDYLSGKYTNPHIASIFDISNPSVKRLRKRLGLPSKYSDEYPIRAERIRQSIELYKKGMGSVRIGKKLSIDDETVRNYLHKNGIRMREVNGFTKNRITRQNKIIKELYPKGVKMKEIEKKVGIKHHGIIIRLKKMGIKLDRRIYTPVGNKYDKLIKRLFLNGFGIIDISKKLRLTHTTVKYRIVNHIFPNHNFKLKWCSKLTGRWKTSKKVYKTLMELKNAKIKFAKYIKEMKVIPLEHRIL